MVGLQTVHVELLSSLPGSPASASPIMLVVHREVRVIVQLRCSVRYLDEECLCDILC